MVASTLSRLRSGITAGLALGIALPAAAANVSTSWVSLASNNQEECLTVGMSAIQALGFRGTVSGDRQAIFGWRNDETLTVLVLPLLTGPITVRRAAWPTRCSPRR